MKKMIISFCFILLSILIVLFFYNDEFLFKTPIIKITNILEVDQDYDTNDLGLREDIYLEEVTGILLNGKDKGKKIVVEHEYSESFVVSEKYNVGDKVFVSNGEIDGLKRDHYFIAMIMIVVLSIYFVGQYRGLFTVISVISNSLLFYIDLVLYFHGMNFIFLILLSSILFTTISLITASGFNLKTFISILSVFLCSTLLFILIGLIALITGFKGVNFNILSYLTVPPEEIFITGLIVGGLGAIMDVSITIVSSIFELFHTNPKITNQQIINSSREIGKDIMPTMINVLFFTYFCGGLPLFVLAIRNGFSIYNYLTTFYTLEITRFLCGGIGICLTIPISVYLTIFIYRRRMKYE